MKLNLKEGVLTPEDMSRIHQATLKLLSEKGVVFESETAVETFRKHGARVEGNVVYIPESIVEQSLKSVPSKFTLKAVNNNRSVIIGEGLAIHPAGGEVFIQDFEQGRRSANLEDFANLQKIYQACDNINITGYQPLSPGDVPQRLKGMYCAYNTMLHTDKPWLAPMDFVGIEEKDEILDLYEIVFGADFMRENYVTWNVVSPNSPMLYTDIACEGIIGFAKRNQPIVIVSAPMSGITAPIHMMGAILLQNTETIAGLCLAQLIKPGIPVLPSASLTFGNLKLATWECACPDTALMLTGAIQMYKNFYNFPARAQTGVTSSKCIDYQAGFESMQSLLLSALSGVNVTSQSVGSLDNLISVSIEKTIIDDEIVSRVQRILKGIDTSDESLSLDIIMDVRHGQDFFTHDSTLNHFRDGWQAYVSDWNLYENWIENENRDIVKRANLRAKEILSNAENPLLDPAIAKQLLSYIKKIG